MIGTAVDRRHHLAWRGPFGEAGEVCNVDEHHRHLDFLAREVRARSEDVLGDFAIDVGAEGVADAFAVPKAGHHAVEACLEKADLASVVDEDLLLQGTLLDALDRRPHAVHRLGERAGCGRGQDAAGEQAGDDEKEDRPDQIVTARLASAEERHRDGDQRDPRAEGP